MLDENELYVIETDGSIHVMNLVGDSDWDTEPTTSLKEIRNKAIDEFAEKLSQEFIRTDEDGNLYIFAWITDFREIAEQMKGK